MSKKFKILFVSLFLLLVVFYVNSMSKNELLTSPDEQLVSENNCVISPSGLYILKMKAADIDHIPSFAFIINKVDSEETIFSSETYFRMMDTHYLLWGEDDTVWVYSSDLGTYYWKLENGIWEKQTYAENKNNVAVPSLLQELEPNYF